MSIFISGATGFIGEQLSLFLANSGTKVHALVRSPQKAKNLQHSNIQLFYGDILDINSLQSSIKGCEQIYHLAAYAKVWSSEPDTFYQINVQGTLNVLNVALQEGVKRVVLTSTAGVFGPSIKNTINEKSQLAIPLTTEYEKTKRISEQKALEFTQKGLEVVIVNPTRVFGSGQLSQSNAVTTLIQKFNQGKWRIIPGNGESQGNYVWVHDVVKGHVIAMEKGHSGENYILGGENISYNELFKLLRKLTGKNQILFKLPLGIMLLMAKLMMLTTKFFKRPPLITPNFVKKYNYNWNLSSDKAKKELGYQPTSLKEAIQDTIEWLNKNN